MKKILSVIAIATAVCFTISAAAQKDSGKKHHPKWTSEERAQMQTKKMVEKFALTAEQEQKINDINLQFAKEHEAKMKEKMEAMKKKQEERNAAYKSVLTDKQYADYLSMIEQRKQKMKDRMKNWKRDKDEQSSLK